MKYPKLISFIIGVMSIFNFLYAQTSSQHDAFISAHETGLARIRTLSCVMEKYELSEGKKTLTIKQDYWRQGENVRCRSLEFGRPPEDWLCRDGKIYSLTRFEDPVSKKMVVQGSFTLLSKAGTRFDLWSEALLNLPYGNTSLSQLESRGFRVTTVQLAPKWTMRWENTELKSWIEASLDPARHFRIRSFQWGQLVERTDGRTQRSRAEYEVSEFKELDTGDFFPKAVQSKHFVNDTLILESVTKFDKIELNKPIPDSRFTLPLPKGSHVYNAIDAQSYPADENWNRVGTAKPVMRAPKSPPPETPPQTVTPPEPALPWWGWPLLALLFTSLIGGAIYWRRRKS